jgi:hypothetical protein
MAFAQSREGEPVHISRNAKSFVLDFFSFKRMMYVTLGGGHMSAQHWGENLCQEGFIVIAELFCKPEWSNKDDFLFVTVRFITVDFFQHVLLFFSCVKSVWTSFICSLLTVDVYLYHIVYVFLNPSRLHYISFSSN